MATAGTGAAHAATNPSPATSSSPVKLTPAQAWAKLWRGNRHWIAGRLQHPHQTVHRRAEVAQAQSPFAAVVTCIDSRISPEIVFDQGIGDLFCLRTGAHTVDGLVTASIEYGPVENGTPLIVVMGHQRCGAVKAAVEAIESGHHLPGHLDEIVSALRGAYEEAAGQGGDIVDKTVRAHTLRTVNDLAADDVLASLIEKGELGIAGTYYSLDTGQVSLLKAVGFNPS
ncbi:carbonic anhydrase [Actinomadura sp. NPDC047616]|uniref:carbonic anhydrase n=1 Tax=Actinomadura sp. NPDC047616 TaxID=3155914 RepID=UPI0033FDE18F